MRRLSLAGAAPLGTHTPWLQAACRKEPAGDGAQVRKNGTVPWVRPDGKTQVTCEYRKENGAMIPIRVHTILISTQHSPDVTNDQIHADLMEHVIKPVVPAKYLDDKTIFHLNPSGAPRRRPALAPRWRQPPLLHTHTHGFTLVAEIRSLSVKTDGGEHGCAMIDSHVPACSEETDGTWAQWVPVRVHDGELRCTRWEHTSS